MDRSNELLQQQVFSALLASDANLDAALGHMASCAALVCNVPVCTVHFLRNAGRPEIAQAASDLQSNFSLRYLGGPAGPLASKDLEIDFFVEGDSIADHLHSPSLTGLAYATGSLSERLSPVFRRVLMVQGVVLGVLSLYDRSCRTLDDVQQQALEHLSHSACCLLESRYREREQFIIARRFHDFAWVSGDWLWETDGEKLCTWMSSSVEMITGVPSENFIGHTLPNFEIKSRSQAHHTFHELLDKHLTFEDVEVEMQTPLGTRIMCLSAVPYVLKGEHAGFRGVARDITEQKRAEELAQQRDMLERASRSKTEFLSRVSHEIRTPLNAIIGFTQLLFMGEESKLSELDARRLENVSIASRKLLELIDDMLDISRIESGQESLQMRVLDVQPCVELVARLLEEQASRMDLTIRNEIKPSMLYVRADRQALEQILVNLVMNVIKYNNHGGVIQIYAEARGDFVHLCVRDSGLKLKTDQLAQVFEPFSRIHVKAKQYHGNGLSMVIAKKLAESMNGFVDADSSELLGTTFRVALADGAKAIAGLPDHVEELKDTIFEQEPASWGWSNAVPLLNSHMDVGSQSEAGQELIVYIEDDAASAELIRQVISSHPGYTLEVANSLSDAETLFRSLKRSPVMAMIDINLPDGSGIELLRHIRLNPRFASTWCIAVSANAMPQDIDAAMQEGFDDYWTKPVDVRRLSQVLQKSLPTCTSPE